MEKLTYNELHIILNLLIDNKIKNNVDNFKDLRCKICEEIFRRDMED